MEKIMNLNGEMIEPRPEWSRKPEALILPVKHPRLAKYKLYRRFCGGTWQKLVLGGNISIWRQVKRPLPMGVCTEEYK